jgi:hypothetical protein
MGRDAAAAAAAVALRATGGVGTMEAMDDGTYIWGFMMAVVMCSSLCMELVVMMVCQVE